MRLRLGFRDYPYSSRVSPMAAPPRLAIRRRRVEKLTTRSQKRYGEGKTTGQVAKELEAKYGILASFWEQEKGFIEQLLGQHFRKPVLSVFKRDSKPVSGATDAILKQIIDRFERGLSREKYFQRGKVPTWQSMRGVQHQFQHPYVKSRGRRPSFIDTGMYRASFEARLEDD